jgi:class 3 adenylate cyclase
MPSSDHDLDYIEELVQLEHAIRVLEEQRGALGDAVTDLALAQLKEKLVALKQKTLGEQRKLVTVLFADLVGFTSTAEKLIPEDVNEILDLFFACWRATAQAYGGLIEKFIGDAVMVVYGLSAVHEDDADLRAFRSAFFSR